MKFYDCKTAPSSRRARIFIAEKGIDVETIYVDLESREHMGQEFRRINPNCTVPVLEIPDGTRFTTTAAIWAYLESKYPNPALIGETAKERGVITDIQWQIEVNGFLAMAEFLRNSAPTMKNRALPGPYDYEQIPDLADRGKSRTLQFLSDIEEIIGDKPYVAGDKFSIADIDLLVFVDFAGWRKLTLPTTSTNALRWYRTIRKRPSSKI